MGGDRDGPRSAPPPVVTPAAADCAGAWCCPSCRRRPRRMCSGGGRSLGGEGGTVLPAAGMEEEAPADPSDGVVPRLRLRLRPLLNRTLRIGVRRACRVVGAVWVCRFGWWAAARGIALAAAAAPGWRWAEGSSSWTGARSGFCSATATPPARGRCCGSSGTAHTKVSQTFSPPYLVCLVLWDFPD